MIKKNNVIPKKENILIVDDDESTRKTLAFIFNKKGYNVETVGTGHEALEMAQQKSFNLALLDIKLPDIEGIELLVPLKKMHPDMETIMMTAYSSLETVIRALNEGASAYIIKPLNLDDVLNKINSIFERQRLVAEKNKLEQELHYQAMLVENVSDAIISTDINLTIKSWNKAAEIIYGWKSDEIIGKAMSEIIPEKAPYAQNEKVREHIFEKGFWRGEINQQKKDNTMLNIFSSATLIKDNSGKIQGVVAINRDITESKKAELKLKEETEKAKKYLDIAGVILVVLDKEGNIVLLNKRGYEILQYAEGELIGRNWFETCLPKHNRKEVYEVFKKLMQNEIETIDFYENSILTKNEEEKIIAWHNVILFDNKGEINGTLSSGEDITAQKKAEIEIVNLARFPSENPNPVLRVTKEKVIYANEAGEELFKITKDVKLPELFRTLVSEAIDEGITISSEVDFNKKNYSLNVTPIKEEGYVNIYGRDISERKKKEEELRLHGEIITNMSEGVFLIRVDDGTIVYTNPAFEEMFRYNPGEIIGKNVSIINAPMDKSPEEIRDEITKILLETGKWHGEIKNVKKDGTLFWCYANVSLFDHPKYGKIMVSIHTDITERKKAEEELASSEEFLNTIIEQSPISLWVSDSEGTLIKMNQSCRELFGATDEEVVGKYNLFEDNLIKEQGLMPLIENSFEKGSVARFTIDYDLPRVEHIKVIGATHRILDVIVSPIKDIQGKITNAIVQHKDITERKQVEVELRKTMKDLKNSNIELEQFAYVASHDLQEPLRMVASFTQLLQDRYKDKLDEDANDFINYAVDGATRMQNLINDLLTFSRVGSRGKPFKIVDMNVVIDNVLNNLRQLIKETHSMIIYDPLPVIEADESQMIQLFQNLISNGIKFRGERDPIIHVTAETKANKWIFTVKDNGIGIDNKFFDRIFIIFQRLHKKSEYGGTGIGLAVCKKIVQRHGGKIWVDSEFGKGSSFHVSIKKRKQARNSVSLSKFRSK
jgi:PAS domain S-box-containing protein